MRNLTFIIGSALPYALLLWTFPDPTRFQVGKTFGELQQMEKDCEKDLPRSQECSIVITYKAKPIEEEK